MSITHSLRNDDKKSTKLNMDKILMFILILSGCFQNIKILSISNTFALKLYHLIAILLSIKLIRKGKIKTLPKIVNLFFIYIFIISIFFYYFYGFNSLIINYIFAYYVLILIYNLGDSLRFNDWIEILMKVATIILFMAYINIFTHFSQIKFFLSGNTERVILDTFFGGGINIEATWIGLLGVFFLFSDKIYFYLLFSSILSLLYSSRSGLIVNVLLFLVVFLKKEKRTNTRLKKIAFICLLLIALLFVNLKTGMISYILARFSNVGNEKGSLGRLRMWEYILPAFKKNPFGYGLGNAIKSLTIISGIKYAESNLHNMFFQMLLDTGILGFIYYLYFNIKLIFVEIKNVFKNPIVLFLIIYIFMSCIEFRGGDFILYVVVGIYLKMKKNDKYEGGHYEN